MRTQALFSALLSALITVGPARADEAPPFSGYTQRCYPLKTGLGRYCVNQVNGSRNPDVVYFMHGLLMKAEDWPAAETVSRISDSWLKMGKNAPTVVSISYGRLWLATAPSQDVPESLLVNIGEHNIPEIERSEKLHPTQRRLIGASMGGFNAAQLALRYPHLFERVALLCPAILNLSPHTPYSASVEFQREAELEHVSARLPFLELYKFLGSLFLLNEKDWDSANLFNLVKKENGPLPKFMISCGRQDPYGFFKGAEDFTRALESRKHSVEWHPVEGKHCSFDARATREFIFHAGQVGRGAPQIVSPGSSSVSAPSSVTTSQTKALPASPTSKNGLTPIESGSSRAK